MDDLNSSPLDREENTSHSFDESDEKSIKSPIFQESEDNDSEVERSDDESMNDHISESNGAQAPDYVEEDSISVQSKVEEEEVETREPDESLNEDESSLSKNNIEVEQSSDKDEISDNNSENAGELKEQRSDDEQELDEEEIQERKQNVVDEMFGDSDSEDEEYKTIGKKRKHDSEASDKDEDSEEEFFKKKKKSSILRDSDDDDKSDEEEYSEKKKDEEDNEEKNEQAKESAEANEESRKEILPDISSDSSDDELEDGRSNKNSSDLVYDFDIMMAKRKEQNARNRKRKNTDLINDSDDFIADLLNRMKQAAEDDFELNKERKAATRKMKLLPQVVTYLRKIDLRESFLDSGALGVLTDWLTPLPDRSLPNLQVRESLLKILIELNIMDVDRLKSSSIGKAVMYLFKHPKETKENKRLAAKLISNWSRPIFNCDTDYQSISKEDREQRDYANMQKARRLSSEASSSQSTSTASSQPNLKPGDKGWVPRARVPLPSTRDYVVRPKSTIEVEMSRSSRKQVSRLDKHLRNFQEKKRSSKMQRAVKISIEGRKV